MKRAGIACIVILLTRCGEIKSHGQTRETHKNCRAAPTARVNYYTGVHEYDSGSPPALVLQISIAPAQANDEGALITLGCQLANDFPHETVIHALIFDDKEAARSLALYAQDQRKHGAYLWHLRARYELKRSEKQQLIDFLVPFAEDDLLVVKRFRTWIDF